MWVLEFSATLYAHFNRTNGQRKPCVRVPTIRMENMRFESATVSIFTYLTNLNQNRWVWIKNADGHLNEQVEPVVCAF